jgi:heme exporter protein CcmD
LNWPDFFSMDGRGSFVWSAFGAFLLAMLLEVLLLRLRAKRVQAELKDHQLARQVTRSAAR